MSKFTTPVSMQVTQEQYERDLKEPLLELGYKEQSLIWGSIYYNLVNNTDEMLGRLSNEGDNFKDYHNRYFIDHYNPELFLSLASQREGEDLYVGEWLYCIKDSDCGDKNGDFIEITSVDDTYKRDKGAFAQGYCRKTYRKATKEELINHFTKENMKKENGKDTSLPIIGYKLTKPEYEGAAAKICKYSSGQLEKYNSTIDFRHNSMNHIRLNEAGVLSLWFTPIYKQQEQIFKVGNFEVKVKDGKAFHLNDNITEFVKGLATHFTANAFGGYYYQIEDVTFSKTGCQTTSKLSEWLEVFKALNK